MDWWAIASGILVVLCIGLLLGWGYMSFMYPMLTPVSPGTIVQFNFKASPAVVVAAAFGVSGTESHYDDSGLGTNTCAFCEHPAFTISSGGSTWIVPTAFPNNTASDCWKVLSGQNNDDPVTCSSNADCYNELPCSPSHTMDCDDPVNTCDHSAQCFGGVVFTDCPCGASCSSQGRCVFSDPSQVHTFSCINNTCVVADSTDCPPAAQCSLVSTTGQQLSPTDPATGCHRGQTCSSGYCAGTPSVFTAVRTDFRAEGVVAYVDSVSQMATVTWERVRNTCPVHFAYNPNFYQGCIAIRERADATMTAQLFGSGSTNPTGVPGLSQYGNTTLTNTPGDVSYMWPLTTVIPIDSLTVIFDYTIPQEPLY